MIRTKEYIMRLTILFKHLEKGEFVNDYSHVSFTTRNGKTFFYFYKGQLYLAHPIIILETEFLFRKHFRKHCNGTIVYGPKKQSIFFSLQFLYGLDYTDFEHLFITGRQHTALYGGKTTLTSSTAKDFARNIRSFLESIEAEPLAHEQVYQRKVLVEKISKNHPENIFRKEIKTVT